MNSRLWTAVLGRTRTALLAAVWAWFAASPALADQTRIYPAPSGEHLSTDFQLTVDRRTCPVYTARVAPADCEKRWKAMDDKKNSADYFERASFAYFDLAGRANLTVTCRSPITSIRVLPSNLKIEPRVRGNTATFTLREPKQVTVEVNGDWVNTLHIFANPPEKDAPRPDDPNVIYFGRGIHEVSRVVVGDKKTVYIAGGAVVRAVIRPDEQYSISGYSGLKTYAPTFELRGRNIRFRGRGILDGSACTTHSRNPLFVRGSDIRIEGIIIRDSPVWTIPIRQSDRVTVSNVKLIGYRANSDGIDICNSRDVTVDGCFIRTLDDLIVVKSDKGQGPVKRIVAKNCVLWNEVAHALSVGAELREDVDDVLFTNCDVIRDRGREWSLRVYHCDAARLTNIRFEDIRLEESPRLISIWIGKAVWSRDEERGSVAGVTFRKIRLAAGSPPIELTGYDDDHAVEDVLFEDVRLGGNPLDGGSVKRNQYVRRISVRP